MSDLVERLRDYSEGPTSYWEPICSEAADRIEELEIELETANHDQAWQLDHISGIEFKIEELEAGISDVLQTMPPCGERVGLQILLNPDLLNQPAPTTGEQP